MVSNDTWIWFFFKFSGRIRRLEFLLAFLFLMMVDLAFSRLPGVGGLASILLLWPNIAIMVKRLHDMGYSGYYILYVMAGAFVIAILFITTGLSVLLLLALAFGLAFNIWLLTARGQPGVNRYGAPPIGPSRS